VVSYEPIGVVRSPFHERAGMPLQSIAAAEVHGQVEIEPAYAPGLRDLDGFSHLYLICHLHRSVPGDLQVVPLSMTPCGECSRRDRPAIPTRSAFDAFEAECTGWLDKGARRVHEVRADQ
jgi:tRNA-methyltransferase O